MAKPKGTGPGQIGSLEGGSTLLYNFDIDSDKLKLEHTDYLDKNVIPMAQNNPGGLLVVIGGETDRLGNAQHNIDLSNRRIQAVADYLEKKMPGYPWNFKGFGQGVGEAAAAEHGDKAGTRDDLYRAVIVHVAPLGKPIPRKPIIHVIPNPPKQLPLENPSTCFTERECPASKDFSIQLMAGATAGEIVEGAFFVFRIRDTKNQLEAFYTLNAMGAGTPGSPVNPSVKGSPVPFTTEKSTKVMLFGPVGGTGAVSLPVLPGTPPVNMIAPLSFSFREPGGMFPAGIVAFARFDFGLQLPLNGVGIHAGRFKLNTFCRGVPGANRL